MKKIKVFFLFIILIILIRSSLFEPYRIPSGSMIPTMMIGDFIMVNKMSYGLKVPLSDLAFADVNMNPIYIFGESSPKRGDVIVFKFPKTPTTYYIKRVVGLPGDDLEIKDKIVYINGKAMESKEVDGKEIMEDMDEKFKGYNLKFYSTKTGEHEHVIQRDNDNYFQVDHEKQKIPDGKFFVMGDNRDFSYDSRFWGLVPHENIKGKALFVWFSMNVFGEHPFTFRPWRIGEAID